MATAIAAAGSHLYQLHRDGSVWRATGAPCNGDACKGWERLDRNTLTAGGDTLYQLHADGSVFGSTGGACAGDACNGWTRLDDNAQTRQLSEGRP